MLPGSSRPSSCRCSASPASAPSASSCRTAACSAATGFIQNGTYEKNIESRAFPEVLASAACRMRVSRRIGSVGCGARRWRKRVPTAAKWCSLWYPRPAAAQGHVLPPSCLLSAAIGAGHLDLHLFWGGVQGHSKTNRGLTDRSFRIRPRDQHRLDEAVQTIGVDLRLLHYPSFGERKCKMLI